MSQNHTMFLKKIEVFTKFVSITSRKSVREPKNVILALVTITFVTCSSTNGVPCYIVEILELNVITSVLVLCLNFLKRLLVLLFITRKIINFQILTLDKYCK